MKPAQSQFFAFNPAEGAALWRFKGLAAESGIVHAVTPKGYWLLPVDPIGSRHAEKVDALARALGLESAAWLSQVHGARVIRAEEAGLLGEADSLICTRPGLGILVRGADCPLILAAVRGPRGLIVGAAHASWRGTVARAVFRMAEWLVELSGAQPADLRAAIAPSAGPCCYEVGAEVREEAVDSLGVGVETCFSSRDGSLFFDLWAANRVQLQEFGCAPERIETAAQCTICENERWPSWRAEGATAGRMAAIIGIRAD